MRDDSMEEWSFDVMEAPERSYHGRAEIRSTFLASAKAEAQCMLDNGTI